MVKQLVNNLINWFKQSNRYKHTYMGIIIVFLYFSLVIILLTLGINNITLAAIVSSISTITHMIAVEYKDKLVGNKFDWYDIAAGAIPISILIIIIWIITT